MGNLVKLNIFVFCVLFSFNLFSQKSNLMDDFFLLQKEKKSISKDINLIFLTHSLGYPEKSKQNLYILLDKFTKIEFDKNIKEIYEILKDKDYNKEIQNALAFLATEKKSKKMDKEILEIYKKKTIAVSADDESISSITKDKRIEEYKKSLEAKRIAEAKKIADEKKLAEKEKSDKILNKEKNIMEKDNKKEKIKNFGAKIEEAIVLSEWIDDMDLDNSIKYSMILKGDPYFDELVLYLDYLKTRSSKHLKNSDKKSAIYYHFLISVYKKENNKEKALIYLNKLKQEFPHYLKYNKINL